MDGSGAREFTPRRCLLSPCAPRACSLLFLWLQSPYHMPLHTPHTLGRCVVVQRAWHLISSEHAALHSVHTRHCTALHARLLSCIQESHLPLCVTLCPAWLAAQTRKELEGIEEEMADAEQRAKDAVAEATHFRSPLLHWSFCSCSLPAHKNYDTPPLALDNTQGRDFLHRIWLAMAVSSTQRPILVRSSSRCARSMKLSCLKSLWRITTLQWR